MQSILHAANGDGWTLIAGNENLAGSLSYVGSVTCVYVEVARTARRILVVSKWVSAVVVMRLVQDGMLRLDDPVTRWKPFCDRDRIRHHGAAQLFSLTNGITARTISCDGGVVDVLSPLSTASKRWPPRSNIYLVAFIPGTSFAYNGFMDEVLGAVVGQRQINPGHRCTATMNRTTPTRITREMAEGRVVASRWPDLENSVLNCNVYLLAADLDRLRDDTGIQPWVVYQQEEDALLLPAGCPRQVRSLASTTSLEVDFMAPSTLLRSVVDKLRSP